MTTSLVTGANRGIGLELCAQLRARGHEVIAVCRNATPELSRLGVQVEAGVDVASDDALATLAKRLAGTRIDWLVCNAGILRHESLDALDFASVQAQLEVNALGPLRTVHALLANLARGSKVALITSRMGSIADNGSGGAYGYRMSKAALNAAGVSLAHDLKPRGIAVALLHPGYVKTDMTGQTGNITAQESADQLRERIDDLNLADSGGFWHANGERLPW
ncbi:MAG TPA: SDR family oxidoreductase [Polyangiales bacterium]|nr:SDR family oxidoreductase [Polyangiales bacterium]